MLANRLFLSDVKRANNFLFLRCSELRIVSASSDAIDTFLSAGISPDSCRAKKRIAQTLRNDVKLLISCPASKDSW